MEKKLNINEAMLIAAEELALKYGYILVDEKIIIGKKDGDIVNQWAFPDAEVKTRTYIQPVWEEEKEKPEYNCRRIFIDMMMGKPRIHVSYPDGDFCSLNYNDAGKPETLEFGYTALEKALALRKKIDRLVLSDMVDKFIL